MLKPPLNLALFMQKPSSAVHLNLAIFPHPDYQGFLSERLSPLLLGRVPVRVGGRRRVEPVETVRVFYCAIINFCYKTIQLLNLDAIALNFLLSNSA
jgi:hypothetical protein